MFFFKCLALGLRNLQQRGLRPWMLLLCEVSLCDSFQCLALGLRNLQRRVHMDEKASEKRSKALDSASLWNEHVSSHLDIVVDLVDEVLANVSLLHPGHQHEELLLHVRIHQLTLTHSQKYLNIWWPMPFFLDIYFICWYCISHSESRIRNTELTKN